MESDDIVVSRLTSPVGSGNSGDVPAIAALFLRLGCTAFGGPAAHVTLIEMEVVTRRGWLTRADFLDLLGVVQVLPGPNSTELAIHIGHVRGGWRGGIAAGLCFVVPGVLMVWLLASVASVPALRPGMTAAFVVPSDAIVLLIGAALSMSLSRGGVRGAGIATVAVLALVAAGVLLAQSTPAPVARPGPEGIFFYFLRAGASVFGSGYVLLAYLQHDLVDARHWLSLGEVTQASALAQVTPGPLFATATAAGYMIAGHAGALAATVGIFSPAFLSIAISTPIRALIQRSPVVRAGLDGVVVASVAVLGRAIAGFAVPLVGWQFLSSLLAALLLFVGRVQATILLLGAVAAGSIAAVLHFSPS